MSVDNLLKDLATIHDKVTTTPFEPDDHTEETLKSAYESLEKLLPKIQDLTSQDKEKIYPEIRTFMADLEERLKILNERMDELRKNAEQTSGHLQVAKAYSGKIF